MIIPHSKPFLGKNLLSFVKAVKMNTIVEVTHPAKPATHNAAQSWDNLILLASSGRETHPAHPV